uniref:Uncharacterized protein n=1 Tax=Sander lucioperca TaxID=283035 RepID=A0A8D0D7M7_SANLU
MNLFELPLLRASAKATFTRCTVIVTGANSGIGKATAAGIVKLQGRVIMACRDLRRAEEAAREILQETGSDRSQLIVKQLDLASLTSVHTFCRDIIKPNVIKKFSIFINDLANLKCV